MTIKLFILLLVHVKYVGQNNNPGVKMCMWHAPSAQASALRDTPITPTSTPVQELTSTVQVAWAALPCIGRAGADGSVW
jgi:hypothetical protein